MDRYYDRQGKPITMELWGALFNDPDYQVLAQTKGCGRMVSTVWLGINHNFSGKGPPVIFESMVFAEGADDEVDCVRYSTEEEAREGHVRLCKDHAYVLDRIVKKLEESDEGVDDSG